MSKKKTKEKKSRPLPKPNRQISNSMIRPFAAIGVNPILQRAREFPIHSCWIMNDWQASGLTNIIVARTQEDGRILFGSYLVDLLCLGLKDCFTRSDYAPNRFQRDLPDLLRGDGEPISVELAHEIIHGAIEYARGLGLEPHPDFQRLAADQVLDPPDAHPRSGQVEFGKNGKPLFIPGPYDNEVKISAVLGTLKRTVGEGNFDFLMMG